MTTVPHPNEDPDEEQLPRFRIINLHEPQAICSVCGEIDLSKWGIPIDCETGLICSNDFEGDWAAKPACRDCWKKHDEGGLVGIDPPY